MKPYLLAVVLSSAALLSGVTQAKRPTPKTGPEQLDYYISDVSSYKDYMLQCSGCHRFDGAGAELKGIPSFVDSIGLFTRFAEGRAYMIRVPGSAQSQITNDELAAVLNWIVAKYSPNEYLEQNFRLFTAAEVGASRPYRFDDVAAERNKLTKTLNEQGLEPATYLYGKVGR